MWSLVFWTRIKTQLVKSHKLQATSYKLNKVLHMTKFAFVFPGQGSQSRGMMNGYADYAAVRDTFTEASDVLQQDMWQLVAEGSDADLNATVNTQPVMLTAGVAVYRAWPSQNGGAPAIM